MSDAITSCPKCGARLWVRTDNGPELRCPCGHEFIPTALEVFLTGKEKRERQEIDVPQGFTIRN